MNVLNKPINVRLTKLSHKVVQFAGISLLSFALPVSATEISKNSMNSFAINIDSELGLAKFGEMATLGLTDPTKLDRCSYRQMQ